MWEFLSVAVILHVRCVVQTGSCRERYKSPSYQIKEGECVNVDVTGPGATMTLGLMFFNTNNRYDIILYAIVTDHRSGPGSAVMCACVCTW